MIGLDVPHTEACWPKGTWGPRCERRRADRLPQCVVDRTETLPPRLTSADAVGQVCVAAGLPGKNEETTTPQWVVPGVLTVAWIRHPGVVYLYRHPGGEHYASLFPGATGDELFAAIQAARSAS